MSDILKLTTDNVKHTPARTCSIPKNQEAPECARRSSEVTGSLFHCQSTVIAGVVVMATPATGISQSNPDTTAHRDKHKERSKMYISCGEVTAAAYCTPQLCCGCSSGDESIDDCSAASMIFIKCCIPAPEKSVEPMRLLLLHSYNLRVDRVRVRNPQSTAIHCMRESSEIVTSAEHERKHVGGQ